jgi:5S rRNA maturation endonuclease (ribonuclease M5)
MSMPLTIQGVGAMFSLRLPSPPGRCKCPFRKHKRAQDKTFRVFVGRGGVSLVKCWSCSDGEADGDNCGDAVWLYSKLAGISRKEAWLKLKSDGYAVPGMREDGQPHDHRPTPPPRREEKKALGAAGAPTGEVLPLDPAKLATWSTIDTGALAEFSMERCISIDVLRRNGVIEMPSRTIGFVYSDRAGAPCRVKIRPLDRKTFWIEPRGVPEKPGAKALAPLYLAERLPPREVAGSYEWVAIVEGEVDALSLKAAGIENTVSLPDGYASAATVNILPLHNRYNVVFLATDKDDDGEKAARMLRERCAMARVLVARVRFQRTEAGELQTYKDANDALCAGFTRDDFLRCFEFAASEQLGLKLKLVSARVA